MAYHGPNLAGGSYTDGDTRHSNSLSDSGLEDGHSQLSSETITQLRGEDIMAEQGQWLLQDADVSNSIFDKVSDDKKIDDLEGIRPRPRREPLWRTCLFFAAVVGSLLSLLMLVKIGFFDTRATRSNEPAKDHTPVVTATAALVPVSAMTTTLEAVSTPTAVTEHEESPAETSFRRPESDYVLDPQWDFDAPPTAREYNWVVQNIEANPDGVFRTMTTINGKFPGELIRCNEGDTIVVNVENRAVNATALHWHGLFQNGTNYMDGTPGATQCPIAPGRSFRYEFTVRGQSGTCEYNRRGRAVPGIKRSWGLHR